MLVGCANCWSLGDDVCQHTKRKCNEHISRPQRSPSFTVLSPCDTDSAVRRALPCCISYWWACIVHASAHTCCWKSAYICSESVHFCLLEEFEILERCCMCDNASSSVQHGCYADLWVVMKWCINKILQLKMLRNQKWGESNVCKCLLLWMYWSLECDIINLHCRFSSAISYRDAICDSDQ